eukprot:GHVL01044808.1.p1 GENE.GHVL01044808.1~~GHVL01044808.1.p1  ORF type:complete len:386 (+),score=72.68 GHVL01044808.1:1-1158(+)
MDPWSKHFASVLAGIPRSSSNSNLSKSYSGKIDSSYTTPDMIQNGYEYGTLNCVTAPNSLPPHAKSFYEDDMSASLPIVNIPRYYSSPVLPEFDKKPDECSSSVRSMIAQRATIAPRRTEQAVNTDVIPCRSAHTITDSVQSPNSALLEKSNNELNIINQKYDMEKNRFQNLKEGLQQLRYQIRSTNQILQSLRDEFTESTDTLNRELENMEKDLVGRLHQQHQALIKNDQIAEENLLLLEGLKIESCTERTTKEEQIKYLNSRLNQQEEATKEAEALIEILRQEKSLHDVETSAHEHNESEHNESEHNESEHNESIIHESHIHNESIIHESHIHDESEIHEKKSENERVIHESETHAETHEEEEVKNIDEEKVMKKKSKCCNIM